MALARQAERNSTAAQDPDYPTFHVAPPVGRLNDPNGLIVDGDTYHAFYQYTPHHPRRLVYWGHATSPDLVNWTQHAPAIAPDCHQDANGAYSGTAIATPDGVELWYTGNYKDPVTDEREATQCVVTTPDLKVFTKITSPIIERQPDGYTAHFRDPQVWQDTDDLDNPAGSYRMLLGVQRDNLTGAALLYRSHDLRNWVCEGEMTFPDAHGAFDNFGYMWECPNLVRLRDESTGEIKDVLIFCPQGIDPDREGFDNIFACVYIVGNLVGAELRGADGSFEEVDRGFEFYAPQVYARRDAQDQAVSWNDVDGDPKLLIGWAGNADEDAQPSIESGGWVHCLTSPRALALVGGRLVQRPFLPGLPLEGASPSSLLVEAEAGQVAGLEGSRAFRFAADVAYEDGAALVVDLGEASGVRLRLEAGRMVVDRSGSRYPHGGVREVTLSGTESGRFELIVDHSLVEVFVGGGSRVFTFRAFVQGAEGQPSGPRLSADGRVRLDEVEVARLD